MVKIEVITRIHAPMERCFDLARNVEVHLAGNVHSGEKAVALEGVTSGLIDLGQPVTWRARHFGVAWKLTSEITAMDRPRFFQDAMTQGRVAEPVFLACYMRVLLHERNSVLRQIAESSDWRKYLP
jgi:hypothetical protein